MGIMGAVNPLVAFLPGFAQRGDAWAPVTERVAQKYRSLAIDFASWTFDGRLREIAERVDDGDVVVGYSMGGRLALAAALRRPGQFGAVVLVGTSAGNGGDPPRAPRRGPPRGAPSGGPPTRSSPSGSSATRSESSRTAGRRSPCSPARVPSSWPLS